MLKMEYDSVYEHITKGATIRSKALGMRKAKKAISIFFLNLETHKKAKSSVRKVFSMKECKSQILKTFCRRFKTFIPISVKAILSDQLFFA